MNVNNGATIIWENHDNVTHKISGITFVEAIARISEKVLLTNFVSDDIEPGETFELTLNGPGTFHYFDKYYPELKGQIFVFEENAQFNAETEIVLPLDTGLTFNKAVTGIAFTPNGKMFYTENHGDVWIVENGKLLDEPFLTMIDEVNFPLEDGKTPFYQDKFPVVSHGWRGIAVDPDYDKNHYVYLTRMFQVIDNVPHELGFQNRHTQLIRVTDVNNTATDLTILIEDVPGIEHAGGPIVFGDDGKIYFPTGDNALSVNSQDISKITGKILRINPDGTIPSDNPFPNSPVYTYGHREVFGLAKHPETGNLYSADNGPYAEDEINLLIPGGNYGWPVYSGHSLITPTMLSDSSEYIPPLLEWKQVLGPTNAIFYSGDKLPFLKNKLIVGTFNLGILRVITLGDNPNEITSDEILFAGHRPVIAIAESPDGFIYFSTDRAIERIVSVDHESMQKIKESVKSEESLKSETFDWNLIFLLIIILVVAFVVVIITKNKKRQKLTN